MKPISFAVMGGDERLFYTACRLAETNCPVHVFGLKHIEGQTKPAAASALLWETSIRECLRSADVLVGPVPFCGPQKTEIFHKVPDVFLPLYETLSFLKPSQHLFGGVLPEQVCSYCQEHGVFFHDFMKMETVGIENAIATAEGSLAEAITRSPKTLHGARCLVLGYGKCAQVLAEKLYGLHAHVTVCARNESQRSMAFSRGCSVLSFEELSTRLSFFDYIFNTIPARVLNADQVSLLSSEVCIIDLASAPGGIDFSACEQRNICAGLFPGLPGKYAPKTSGEILARAVLSKLPML